MTSSIFHAWGAGWRHRPFARGVAILTASRYAYVPTSRCPRVASAACNTRIATPAEPMQRSRNYTDPRRTSHVCMPVMDAREVWQRAERLHVLDAGLLAIAAVSVNSITGREMDINSTVLSGASGNSSMVQSTRNWPKVKFHHQGKRE
jgi:hypothetical protein